MFGYNDVSYPSSSTTSVICHSNNNNSLLTSWRKGEIITDIKNEVIFQQYYFTEDKMESFITPHAFEKKAEQGIC